MESFDITTLLHGGSEVLKMNIEPKDDDGDDEPTEEEYQKMDQEDEAELAQLQTKTFQDLLKDFAKQSQNTKPKDTLQLRIPLEGTLDFKEVSNILTLKSIVFEKPGKVTHLKNLPGHLLELHAPEQKIQDLGILPKTLKTLEVPNNRLVNLDLKNTGQLEILNVNDNMLKTLENIPLTLRHLLIEGNQLETLDLTGISLQILHISYNQTPLRIFGLPANLQEFQHENTQMETEEKKGVKRLKKGKSIPVGEALENYYRLLGEYTKSYLKHKRTRRTKKSTNQTTLYACVLCQQKGQMVFEQNANRLLAKCGHVQSPCQFHIELDKGMYTHLQTYREHVKAEYDKIAEEIIFIANKIKFGYPLKPTDKKKEQDALEWKEKWETVDAVWKDMVEEKNRMDEMQQLERETKDTLGNLQEQYRMFRDSKTNTLHEIIKQQLEAYEPLHVRRFHLQYKRVMEYPNHATDDFHCYDETTFARDYALHTVEPRVIAMELKPLKTDKKVPAAQNKTKKNKK